MDELDLLTALLLSSLQKYNEPTREEKRETIFTLCERTCEYLHSEKVKHVFFIDRSARPAWVGIKKYWDLHYDCRERPKLCFINPDGFSTQGYKKRVRMAAIRKRFIELFPKVFAEKNLPVVLFDTCSHTGETLHSVQKAFKSFGFTDVRIITANDPDDDCLINTCTSINHGLRLWRCNLFDLPDSSVVKKGNDIICIRSSKREYDRKLAVGVREGLRHIIIEYNS